MSFLSTIFMGLITGMIARFITPGKTRPRGLIMTTLVGIFGAMFAGYMGERMGIYQMGDPVGLFGAVIGAIVLLLIYRALFDNKN